MPQCPACQREYDVPQGVGSPEEGTISVCPHCGHEQSAEIDGTPRTAIANITNLAELGYFEEILHQAGFDIFVRQRDDYSAIDGQWRRRFIVFVPDEQAPAACELLSDHLRAEEETASGEGAIQAGAPPRQFASLPQREPTDDDLSLDPSKYWVPAAMVVLAGGLLYWVVVQNDDASRRPGAPALWEVLSDELSAPLLSDGVGENLRRLWQDPKTGRIVLDEDTDGDGKFDRRREFVGGYLDHEGPL